MKGRSAMSSSILPCRFLEIWKCGDYELVVSSWKQRRWFSATLQLSRSFIYKPLHSGSPVFHTQLAAFPLWNLQQHQERCLSAVITIQVYAEVHHSSLAFCRRWPPLCKSVADKMGVTELLTSAAFQGKLQSLLRKEL